MSGKKRILVVDDEENMAKSLAHILKYSGYDPTCAYDGQEALDLCREQQYCCVITDIKMPKMDGIELSRLIHKESPETKVILITAYTSSSSIASALKESAMVCLSKPVDLDVLLDILSK